MTIRFEKPNFFDRILAAVGKRRGVIIPGGVYQKYGPYALATAKRESFWKALLRPKGSLLPDGVIMPEDGDLSKR